MLLTCVLVIRKRHGAGGSIIGRGELADTRNHDKASVYRCRSTTTTWSDQTNSFRRIPDAVHGYYLDVCVSSSGSVGGRAWRAEAIGQMTIPISPCQSSRKARAMRNSIFHRCATPQKIEYLRKLACFQILGGLHVRSHASGNSLEVTIANRHAVS